MFLAIFLLFIYSSDTAQSKLLAYIKAVLIWTASMYFSLEILSVFNAITPLSCYLFWGAADIILLFLSIQKYRHKNIKEFITKICCKDSLTLYAKKILTPWNLCFVLIICITLYFALRTVPNNYDSMTYRLPRIMHWFQNHSVAHYASNSVRQVTSPALADFINLYVYSMTGRRDVFFNLIQWSSYITNTAFVIGIAHKLKCRRSICMMSGFLFMTTPIAFAESMTTQNDNLSAMYLLFFVYILLDLYTCEKMIFKKSYIEKTVMLSLCIAFAYLTKPSVMFGIVIFALGLLAICIKRKDSFCALLKLLAVSAVSIIITVFPEICRNLYTFHAISDPIAGSKQLVGTLNPKYLFINFLKNSTFNSPNIYFNNITSWIQNGIYKLADFIGVSINDTGISENGADFEMLDPRNFHHDTAVNPIIFYSLILCIFLLLFFLRKAKFEKLQSLYCLLSISSFCIFCIFLRWERFVTRYMIAYLALLCPAVLILLNSLCSAAKTRYLYYAVLGILAFASSIELLNMIPYHYKESERTLDTHDVEYFHNHGEDSYYVYDDIVHYIYDNNYQNIGLLTFEVTFEYPLWAMLLDKNVTIKHVNVQNQTQIYEDMDFIPDCLIVNGRWPKEDVTCHGIEYHRIDVGDDSIYLYAR